MADDVSKTTVAILLILTVVVSVIGTSIVISKISDAQNIDITQSTSSGEVSLEIENPPTISSGEVKLEITNGGGQ